MRSETLIDHPKFRVERRTGAEGPRFDPYAWEELIVTNLRGKMILHQGLGVWYSFNEHRVEERDVPHVKLIQLFEEDAGYTIEQIERIARKLKSRCPKCGGRDIDSESGFPGETLYVCARCSHIVGSSMNYGAIE